MKRKDCERHTFIAYRPSARRGWAARLRSRHFTLLPILMLGCLPSEAPAGSIRVWPSAVVVDEQVRLADLCELRGFSLDEEAKLRDLIITEAPAQGGSRIIHAEVIRKTLAAAGTNTALVTLGGAVECAISRPAALAPAAAAAPNRTPGTAVSAPTTDGAGSSAVRETPSPDLRRILIDYFNNELTRYGGTAEVSFDRSAEQILSLSGPQYQFDIRRRAGQALGTVALEIDVLANGSRLQTAPLVVQVAMRREVVVARRTVNQGATVSKSDVELLCLTFNRVDEPGMNELAEAIGQRAKRVIPAGTYLVPDLLEKVPLVLRGQLVTLSSVEGSIAVVTTAKAMADAHLGEVIKVRSVDDSHVEMDAIVTGPGEVKVGRITQTAGPSMLARGGDR